MLISLYQQLISSLYSSTIFSVVMDNLVYNRRRYRRYRSYDGDGEYSPEALILLAGVILIGAWLTFSRYIPKVFRYIIAVVPVISAVALFPMVISHYKFILMIAAGSVAALFIYQITRNSDDDYEGTFLSTTVLDYFFASGIVTTAVEILFLTL